MMLQQQFSKIIFVSCLSIVIISFTSLVFPAFLIEITNDLVERDVNLFQFGIWTIPILACNIAFILCYFLYKKNKLPSKIISSLDFIIKKDISKRTTLIIFLILFLIYIIFTIDEFGREEFELGDYKSVISSVKNFEFTESLFSITPQLRYFILHVSYVAFDNVRILPFIASISLLLITFFLTLEITKKRLSAIIAFCVLLQSNLFLIFDTTASYENFWTAFYFFSLYLIFRKPSFSGVSFVLSMLTKPLTVAYLPINIFAIFNNKTSKHNKIFLIISYGIIISIILVAYFSGNLAHTARADFDINRFISSLNEMGNSLRLDSLILVCFIPSLILLSNKRGEIRNKINIIFVGIFIVILSQPIMFSLNEMTLQPYRFIPLIVFCAIGIGTVFSNSNIQDQE